MNSSNLDNYIRNTKSNKQNSSQQATRRMTRSTDTVCPNCHNKKKEQFKTCYGCYLVEKEFRELEIKVANKRKKIDFNKPAQCKYYSNRKCIQDGKYCNENRNYEYDCFDS